MDGANGSVGVTPTGVIVVRLLASALMAAVIGWERSFSQKPAGARTMIMIGVGAAAFALLGEELLVARAASEGVTAEPTRVLAYIISGVGFLGAGTILHSKKSISGLTTAATIWAVAALGASCGVGELRLAGIVFAFIAGTMILPHLFWKLGDLEFLGDEDGEPDGEDANALRDAEAAGPDAR